MFIAVLTDVICTNEVCLKAIMNDILKLLVAGCEITTVYTMSPHILIIYGVLVGRKRTCNVYIKYNSDARSRYCCRRGKSIIITYSECGYVALFIHNMVNLFRQ